MAKKRDCPLWQAACKEHECRWYVQVIGHNPNTGEDMNKWDCAMAWLPILAIEHSLLQRHTSSEVHEFRNDMAAQNDSFIDFMQGRLSKHIEGQDDGSKLIEK